MGPMLCILFLGARMRALQMDPINGAPQAWAQNCFYMCAYALLANTLLAILVPLVMNGEAKYDDKGLGDVQFEVKHATFGMVLVAVRWVCMISIYAGFTAVIYSVFTIEHPDGADKTPPISPAMQCVINLTVQFFFIYLMLWVFLTLEQFGVNLPGQGTMMNAMEAARATVQYAPMLAILFVATRMRALQITQQKGAPQGWAQDGMYLASWAVLIQFMMCLVMPMFTGKKFTPDSLDGSTKTTDDDINAMPGGKFGAVTVTVVRYTALLAMLGGTAMVVTGALIMTPETATGRGSMVPGPPGVNDIPGTGSGMEAIGSSIGSGANAVNDGAETVTG